MAAVPVPRCLRLSAARLTANSRLCVNVAFEIRLGLLLGVNVATTYFKIVDPNSRDTV